MEIRRLSVEDAKTYRAELVRLLAACTEASYAEAPESGYYEKKLGDLEVYLAKGQACVLAALDGGAMLGFLWGYPVSSPVGPRFHIAYFAVMPEARRQGVGRGLLQAAGQEARAMGLDQFELIVSAANTSAVEFYCSQGFQTDRFLLNRPLKEI